ncbi:L,D-transpeptidase-like protein [Roseimicrobium gellanilyticum]|uniref:L,D-transpeptidase-like protein n=1 Tax=Roseimicrobium gellanilyticum TaxID=748857 RepID=A0A366HJR4_9BACT|nr:L,D-transpeptidase family protein [Roseimicrobium gellanilyticum]RBP42350.1 L,D-transpeptidase-like protein [Roseimicrobium gellanilyticum]
MSTFPQSQVHRLRRLLAFCLLVLLSTFGTSCTVTEQRTIGRQADAWRQNAFRYGQQKVQDMREFRSRLASVFRADGSFWEADEMRGRPSIKIDLGDQMVYFYKGGELAGASPISSGREGYDTRPGRYSIIEKDIDHKSSIYGDYEDMYGRVVMKNVDNRKHRRPPGTRFEGAKMNYFMRIYGGVGMHEGYLPGYAASHGCIRLPGHMARKFYNATPMGTPVSIVP